MEFPLLLALIKALALEIEWTFLGFIYFKWLYKSIRYE